MLSKTINSIISERDLLASGRPKDSDVEYVKGDGALLYDAAGKRYINLFEIIACLGENNETFLSYMQDALLKVLSMHGNDLHYKRELLNYMMETTNYDFDRVLFTSSGSEAVEWAVKAAKKMTGRSEVITFWNSIHGRTHFSASMSGLPRRKTGYAPSSPGIIFQPYPDCLRCSFSRSPDNCDFYCLEFLDKKVEFESTQDIAAVLIEPYQAEGNTFPPEGFLSALKKWADKKGAMLIFDEIQSGMGRTGKNMYRYQSENVKPDMLLLGKAFGNGLHMSAFMVKGEIEQKDVPAMAGGSGDCVLGCAAACAVYKELLDNGLMAHIKETGDYFKAGLMKLKAEYDKIAQVRGEGLALAVDFNDGKFSDKLFEHMKDNGLIPARNKTSIVFKPPYSITKAQVDEVLQIIADFLACAHI